MEAYLSRNQPRWSPETEVDIQAVIDNGVLGESHYIDVKQEIAPGQGGRRELARDLASFAIDGGALLLGVAEDKQARQFSLHPQPLEGLVERIEQIANFGIDPPLTVIPSEIESTGDDRTGFILINIPPSSAAPHMADGKYYGRGERTRRTLTDAEVVRLHSRKQSAEARIDLILDQEIDRDPVPTEVRKWGHLYLVAQPESGSRSLARETIRNNIANFPPIIDAGSEPLPRNSPYWVSPFLGELRDVYNRANSVALSSYILSGPGRTIRTDLVSRDDMDTGVIDIEVHMDGGVRALFSGVTTENQGFRELPKLIDDAMIVASAIRLVRWARGVSTVTGYRGQWLFGLHADGLRGLESKGWGRNGCFYDEDVYRETTTASTLELERRPNVVARRIVDRLLDGLGVQNAHQAILAEEVQPGDD